MNTASLIVNLPADYVQLLAEIKSRIRAAQVRAVASANAEMLVLYWQVGQLLDRRRTEQGWGAAVIPRLARDLANELPEVKGFSERNLKHMQRFHRLYLDAPEFGQQPVAQLIAPEKAFPERAAPGKRAPAKGQQPVAQMAALVAALSPSSLLALPWGHHILLMAKEPDVGVRRWYAHQAVTLGWSRSDLQQQIASVAHRRQGTAITNFAAALPAPQSELASQALKDPYVFDFLTLEPGFHERELEVGLVRHVERFLLELGQGFAFVGRQFPLAVGEQDFYVDLLFYHLKLRSYMVIELKRGAFKPEYAGKLNFYCNVVDDQLRHPSDAATIGLILCQDKDQLLAEYALRGIDKPIGIASYELTRALPKTLQSALPSIDQIEAELRGITDVDVEAENNKPSSKRDNRDNEE